jgi:AraC family transcriptional regulator
MTPKIVFLSEKKLIGHKIKMSLTDNKTGELWRGFMPRKKDIKNPMSSDVISMQVYHNPLYFNAFHPNNEFEKWAAIEVFDFNHVPSGMETFILMGGKYAVFNYKGSSTDTRIFDYIFNQWLPNSIYMLDDRPHFEVLGEKYKNNDPNSEEDIWIPIKNRPLPKKNRDKSVF